MEINIGNPDVTAILALLLAFTQGGLLGLEREKAGVEQSETSPESYELPGVRTFGLLSTLGAVTSLLLLGALQLPQMIGISILILSIVFVLMLTLMFMYYRLVKKETLGLTTYVVIMMSYLVGFLTGTGHYVASLGLTFLVAGVLASKKLIAKAIQTLSYEEIAAGLELGIIVFILGPIALSTKYEFYGVSVSGAYLFFTLILAISYTSYLIYKVKGSKSVGVIGFLGGLINSEATLVNVLKLVSSSSDIIRSTIIVDSGLVIRTLIISLFGAAPFLKMGGYKLFSAVVSSGLFLVIAIMLFIYFFVGKKMTSQSEIKSVVIGSPLEYRTALRGALIYVILFIASKLASNFLGNFGILGVAFLGGFASAGATVFSLLSLSSTVSPYIIGIGVLLASSSAFLNKIAYAKLVLKSKKEMEYVIISVVPPAVVLLIYSLLIYHIVY